MLSSTTKRNSNSSQKEIFLVEENPRHPSVRFKKVGTLWSVRIDENYRALSLKEGDIFYWFWIGNHENYVRFLARF